MTLFRNPLNLKSRKGLQIVASTKQQSTSPPCSFCHTAATIPLEPRSLLLVSIWGSWEDHQHAKLLTAHQGSLGFSILPSPSQPASTQCIIMSTLLIADSFFPALTTSTVVCHSCCKERPHPRHLNILHFWRLLSSVWQVSSGLQCSPAYIFMHSYLLAHVSPGAFPCVHIASYWLLEHWLD